MKMLTVLKRLQQDYPLVGSLDYAAKSSVPKQVEREGRRIEGERKRSERRGEGREGS